MKKIFLSTTILIAGTFGVLAQGQLVDFTNDPSLPWPAPNAQHDGNRFVYTDFVGGQKVNDTTWTAKLFEGATERATGPFTSYGPDYPLYFGIIENLGDPKTVLGATAGVATTLEIRVYNGAGVFQGASAPFSYLMGSSVPPGPLDTLMVNFKAFAVPEPSTIALGALGLGALLLFRRRK